MESNTFSRRQAVQTIAAAVSTVTAPVSALANVENRDGLFELWKERERLIEECRVLDRQWLEARDRLPSWCRMGAKYLSQNGFEVGPEVGWPRTDDGAILLADGRWLIRPSPSDLRRLSEEDISVVSREQALCLYRHRVSELRNRLRQRRELFSRNGVPRSVDWHRLESRIERVERVIDDLPPCSDVSAAKLIITLEAELDGIPNPMIVRTAWMSLDALVPSVSDYLATRIEGMRRSTLAKHA
jgi:hypothetical protein